MADFVFPNKINAVPEFYASSDLGSPSLPYHAVYALNLIGVSGTGITGGVGEGSVTVTQTGSTLYISGTQYVLPSNVVQSASNSGNGLAVYNSQSGSNLIFNTISGTGSVLVSYSNGIVLISGDYSLPSNVVESGVGLGNVTVSQTGSTLYISGSSIVLPSGLVYGPNPTSVNAIATWGNTSGTSLLNNSLFVSGNNIYDSSSDNITLSNGAISAVAGTGIGSSQLQIEPNSVSIFTNNSIGQAGLFVTPDADNSIFLGSIDGELEIGELADAGINNSPIQSGPGVILNDVVDANGNADLLVMSSGTIALVDLSGDNITLSNGGINAIAASGNTVLGLAPNNLEFYTINEELGYGGLELEPDGYQTLFLYSAGGQFLAGNLASANVTNAIFQSGIGVIVSDMNVQADVQPASADYIQFVSGTTVISTIENDTIVMNSGIALTTSGLATVNGRQIVTSGVGLGNVTVTNSNGTLTVSGSTYTLPSTASFTSLSGTTISGSTITGTTINYGTLAGGAITATTITGTTVEFSTAVGNIVNSNTISGSTYLYTTIVTGNSYVATTGIDTILTTQTSGITISFPVSARGKKYTVLSTVASTTNHVTLSGSAQNINGASTLLMSGTIGLTAFLISDGANLWSTSSVV